MATKGFDLRTAVVAAFKFRWRATMVFLAFIGLAVAVCLVMKTEYTASASMLVKLGRELVFRDPVGPTNGITPASDHDETMASIIAIIDSPNITREAIETIGMTKLYPDMAPGAPAKSSPLDWIGLPMAFVQRTLGNGQHEEPMTTAVRRFSRKLKVDVVKRTGIITVAFSHPDPAIAAEAANLVVGLFQKEVGAIYDNPNLTFMQDLVDKERAGLDSAEEQLSAYQQKYGVYDIDNQIAALLAQKIQIDSNMKSDAAHIAELKILVDTLAAQRAATPQRTVVGTDAVRNRVIDDTESQLLNLRIQERQMTTRYAANYPPLVEVRNQIATAEHALAAARGEPGLLQRFGLNQTYVSIDQALMEHQAELDSYAGRQVAMRAQLASIDTALTGLAARKQMLEDLKRDVALRTDAVKTSYDKLAEARAIDGLNRQAPSSFSLYAAARAPDLADPSRPQPVLYILIAAVFGMLAAATTIFLSYVMDNSFLTPELAAARLRLPVLGVVDYRRNLARLGRVGQIADMRGARDLSRT
jgi:uncharacterized protein involved in exopolysaccharide biosynthesis